MRWDEWDAVGPGDVIRRLTLTLQRRESGRPRLAVAAAVAAACLVVAAALGLWPPLGPGRVSRVAPAAQPAPTASVGPTEPSPVVAPAPQEQANRPSGPTPTPLGPASGPASGATSTGATAPAPARPSAATLASSTASVAPPAAPPAGGSATAIRFSFEDGGTDGWGGHGHVTALGNGTVAHDGSRSLEVSLFSASGSDLPYVSVEVSGASAPSPGRTVTAFVLVARGGPSIQGKVFVQDTRFAWHMSPLVGLGQGTWTELSLTVPSGIAVNQVGVQFLVTPVHVTGTLFLDSVSW